MRIMPTLFRIACASACVTLWSLPSAASADEGYKQCLDNPDNFSTAGAIDCAVAWRKRQDTELNAVWKDALATVGGRKSNAGKLLVEEQRAWITFKDKACNFYWLQPEFGSMHRGYIGPSCVGDIYDARITQLKDIITSIRQN